MKLLLAWAFLLSYCSLALAQVDVQRSHIEANVPAPAEFERTLQRDLLAFAKAKDANASRVQYKLLRDSPTQSGTAYPKFYAWVKVYVGDKLASEGAVRVTAIDRARFEVTHFLDTSAIRKEPQALNSIFPAALVPAILQQAKAT